MVKFRKLRYFGPNFNTNIITPTTNIATRATNGKRMNIILIKFHFLVCAAQRTLLGGLLWWACAKLLYILPAVCPCSSRSRALFFAKVSKCIRASQFHPKVERWVTNITSNVTITHRIFVGILYYDILQFRKVKWWLFVCGSSEQRDDPAISWKYMNNSEMSFWVF